MNRLPMEVEGGESEQEVTGIDELEKEHVLVCDADVEAEMMESILNPACM